MQSPYVKGYSDFWGCFDCLYDKPIDPKPNHSGCELSCPAVFILTFLIWIYYKM
jgi:hypothetical protein